jgi:hypothetical protein
MKTRKTNKPAEFTAARNAYRAAHDAHVTATLDAIGGTVDWATVDTLDRAREEAHTVFARVAARYRMSAI